VFERFSEQARRVVDLAMGEAERAGHRYLGPEHLVLGVLAEGRSGAARVLRARGVDLEAARAALAGLAQEGVVPAPRPSDAELLGNFFLLFDRDATWDAAPPRPVSSGATVIDSRDRLAQAAASLLR